jgi:hypothetical protein
MARLDARLQPSKRGLPEFFMRIFVPLARSSVGFHACLFINLQSSHMVTGHLTGRGAR